MSIDKHLGSKSEYKDTYDPSLLVPEPRINNRRHLPHFNGVKLPCVGYDIWNGYEVSALTNKGKPVVGIARVIYPCDSPNIVESKSMKLYWNSFNNEKLGENDYEVIKTLTDKATNDLSNLIGKRVDIFIQNFDEHRKTVSSKLVPVNKYVTLEQIPQSNNITFTKYQENFKLLQPVTYEQNTIKYYHSSLLMSRCKVTNQPDNGDIYIMIENDYQPSSLSLLEYIVSFRKENHFHEEIVEQIYNSILQFCNPKSLFVGAFYVRRGGWDINPIRASAETVLTNTNIFLQENLHNFDIKLSRQ